MEKIVSGSHESPFQVGDFKTQLLESLEINGPPWGLLIFEQDGSVSSLCADASVIGEDNSRDIMLALDFAHYAFDRPDWMVEYIKSIQDKKVNDLKPKLRLIKGGLKEED